MSIKTSTGCKYTLSLFVALCVLVFLLFFEVQTALSISPIQNWNADDGCYIQHLGNVLGIDGTQICHKSYSNYYARGIVLFWLIPGVLGQWIGLLRMENVTEWIVSLTGATAFIFWILGGCFLSYKLLRSGFSLFIAFAVILNIPVLYYATVRTHMVHSAEFLMSFLVILLLGTRQQSGSILIASILGLTRYNDVMCLLLVFGNWIDNQRSDHSGGSKGFVKNSMFHLFSVTLAIAALVGVAYVGFYWGYHTFTIFDILADLRLSYLYNFLFSSQWGTIWTAPWWILSFVIGTLFLRNLTWQARAAWAWMFSHVILCAAWGGNGSDFAYRYLIGSYAGALIIWLEVLKLRPRLVTPFKWITGAGAVWMTGMTILYRRVPGTQPMWNAQGGCDIPPKITLEIFKNIFNPEPYRLFFENHFVPGILYRDWKAPFLTIPERSVTWGMVFLLFSALIGALIYDYKNKKRGFNY